MPTSPEAAHVTRGPIEKVQDEPVGFRMIRGRTGPSGDFVVPVYALGRKVYETWIEDGQKMGRWHWEYV